MSFHFFKKRGFTLTEFIVVIAISTLILGTVIGGQSRYTDMAALKSVATDLSLNIRQAQVYGIGVKGSTEGQNDFNSPYGISIDSFGNKTTYILYIDKNKNTFNDGNFTCGAGSECVDIYTLTRGNKVNKICRLFVDGSAEICDVGRADIYFQRPSTEARFGYIWDNVGYAQIPVTANLKGLRIELISPKNLTKSVSILKSGQISIQ
jgi:prepilin-type N-terminal cleavage/methylation domain-containing protein